MKPTTNHGAAAPAQIIRDVFGEPPEEVLAPSKLAYEVFDWLRVIFSVVEKMADDGKNSSSIKPLAAAGKYIASDMGNLIECMHENMHAHFKAFEDAQKA